MHVWKCRLFALATSVTASLFLLAGPVAADEHGPDPNQLNKVVTNLQLWVMGILGGVATLFVIVGGARYVLSGGDPSQVEKAKLALRGALVGYALALLAPVVLVVLRGIVGA